MEQNNYECNKCKRTSNLVNLNESCPFCNPYASLDEKFDKKFVDSYKIWDCYNDIPAPKVVKEIKKFIHTALDEAYDRGAMEATNVCNLNLAQQRKELAEQILRDMEDCIVEINEEATFCVRPEVVECLKKVLTKKYVDRKI